MHLRIFILHYITVPVFVTTIVNILVLCFLQLTYNASDMIGPSVTVYLLECKSPVMLPVEQAVDTALSVLRSTTTAELFYRQHAWDTVRSYLVASINLDDDEHMQMYFFTHPRFVSDPGEL